MSDWSDLEALLSTGEGSCTLKVLREYVGDVLGPDDAAYEGWRFPARGWEFIVENGMVHRVRE